MEATPRSTAVPPGRRPPDLPPVEVARRHRPRAVDATDVARRRLRQPRTILSIVVPLAIIAVFVGLNGEQLATVPGSSSRRTPRSSWSRSSCSTSASRCAASAGRSCCAGRAADQRQGLDRDPVPVVARQLRRAGQARRRLPGVPAQDQQHGVAVADVRDRLHRAHPRPLRDRAARPRGRLLELPERPAAGRSRSCSASASWSWSLRPSACSRCATSAGGSSSPCRCRTWSSSCTTASRKGVFGAVVAKHLPILGDPDRPDLDDRGRCACTSSSRRSGSPTSSSASRARCSSRSSARC